MKRLIQQLGEHFVGLWIYKPYGRRRSWVVTFRDAHGEYWETDLFGAPERALAQAISVIARQGRGELVMATGQVQRVKRAGR